MLNDEVKTNNVNYRGKIVGKYSRSVITSPRIQTLFRTFPPQMLVVNCWREMSPSPQSDVKCARAVMKLIIFKNFKCRLMKCTSFTQFHKGETIKLQCSTSAVGREGVQFQCLMKIKSIMSGSVTYDLAQNINLFKLARYLSTNKVSMQYEPEIFQALRITHYNPLCVNIFCSGSCVILGIKNHFKVHRIIHEVFRFINKSNAGFYLPPINTNKELKKKNKRRSIGCKIVNRHGPYKDNNVNKSYEEEEASFKSCNGDDGKTKSTSTE